MFVSSASVVLPKLRVLDIEYLRTMLKVNGWLRRVTPALHSAVSEYGWCDEVAELLAAGAKVSEQDAEGNTALHVAFLKYKEGLVVEMLMKKYMQETDKNITNKDGLSFVHIACTRPYVDILLNVLYQHSVNVNRKVYQRGSSQYAGYTCLHFAVAFGQHEMAELLLTRHKADLYEQDAFGSTPLHLALESRDVEMIDLLLAYDVKRVNVSNQWGLSHFMVACAGSDGLAVKEYLHAAQMRCDDKLIYERVFNVRDYPFAGYTSLRFAVVFHRDHVVDLLRAFGASIAREMTPIDFETRIPEDDYQSIYDRNETNVCTEILRGAFKIFAFVMLLLILSPSLF